MKPVDYDALPESREPMTEDAPTVPLKTFIGLDCRPSEAPSTEVQNCETCSSKPFDGVKYVYVRVPVKQPKDRTKEPVKSRGAPIACIASRMVKASNGSRTLYFALSIANPKDQFSRSLARQIARGRLFSTQRYAIHDIDAKKHRDVIVAMMEILHGSTQPRRIRKAAAQWLGNDALDSLQDERLSVES